MRKSNDEMFFCFVKFLLIIFNIKEFKIEFNDVIN